MITPQDISIIIPVYNVEKYISECLDSILVANCFTGEVICINDGSTDNSNNILEQYAQQYPNIKHLSQQNQGIGATRNNGLDIATGKYIFFIDSDDTLAPHAIETLCKSVDDEDIVYFDIINQNDKGEIILRPWSKTIPVKNVSGKDYYEHYYNGNVTVWSGIYKKSFLEQNNLRFLPNVYYEDELFTIQALCFAKNVSTIQESIYIYRRHSSSITGSFTMKHERSLLQICDAIYQFIIDNNWETLKTKHNVWSLYYILIYRISSHKNTGLKKLPRKHWKNMMACCSDNIQDIRTTKLARYSIKKAYQYHEYLMPKLERKIVNFFMGK